MVGGGAGSIPVMERGVILKLGRGGGGGGGLITLWLSNPLIYIIYYIIVYQLIFNY